MELAKLQLDSFESDLKRIMKRRSKYLGSQDAFISSVEKINNELRTAEANGLSQEDIRERLSELQDIIAGYDCQAEQKDFINSLYKLSKTVEKAMSVDLTRLIPQLNVDVSMEDVYIAIIDHLFREGRVEIADMLIMEANVKYPEKRKNSFRELRDMLKALRSGDTLPALDFCAKNGEGLKVLNSSIEFELHSFAFTMLIEKGDVAGAVTYARKHFKKFSDEHMTGIKRAMGCLAFLTVKQISPSPAAIAASPYADLFHTEEKLCQKLSENVCGLLGMAADPPLNAAVDAGVEALPVLANLASVISGHNQSSGHNLLTNNDTLPAEVDISADFNFHSVFACPVSKDQATPENPPWMLPCGHVLCKESVEKIARASRGSSRTVKCPYCPKEALLSESKPLHF